MVFKNGRNAISSLLFEFKALQSKVTQLPSVDENKRLKVALAIAMNYVEDENKRLKAALTVAMNYVKEESTRTSAGRLYDIEQALKGPNVRDIYPMVGDKDSIE